MIIRPNNNFILFYLKKTIRIVFALFLIASIEPAFEYHTLAHIMNFGPRWSTTFAYASSALDEIMPKEHYP